MILWRTVLALVLSLTLSLGSVAEVLAQAEMSQQTAAVLCGDTGPLALDGTGAPQRPGHPCTHCLAALAVGVLPQGATLAPPARLVAAPYRQHAVTSRALSVPRFRPARGPPPLA